MKAIVVCLMIALGWWLITDDDSDEVNERW